jgi:hypothetical protein
MTISIDWGQMDDAAVQTARAAEARRQAAAAQCARRILAVCNEHAQINLASAAAAGLLSEDDLATYRLGLAWVTAMRQHWRHLADLHLDPADDSNWPGAPPAVAALARRF